MTKHNGSLVGMFFHSYKDGKIYHQGHIVRELKNDKYLVQYFSWMTGLPTDKKIVSESDMMNWSFYSSDKEMRCAYCLSEGLDPEQEEKFVGIFG